MTQDVSTPPANQDEKLRADFERRLAESMPKAIIGGCLGGILGAVIWATVTYLTNYQIGWLAIGIGFLVGLGVRLLGKGSGVRYRVLGGALALLACGLGNYFVVVAVLANQAHMGIFEVLGKLSLAHMPEILKETFSPMDALFYALAAWFGWKYSSLDE